MKLNKIFKLCMLVLLLISVGILIWGFVVGFDANGDQPVEVLIYWAYIMIALALASWVVAGGIVSIKNNPKSIVKTLILVVALVAVIAVAYVLAPGNPAFGREGQDPVSTLKLVDTVLNLTYFAGAATLISIVVGEIRLAITNKK